MAWLQKFWSEPITSPNTSALKECKSNTLALLLKVLKKSIISSDCPTGPKEILENGKNGMLFKVGSHKELTKKIIEYSKNKKKFKKKTEPAFNSLYKYDLKSNLNEYYFQISKLC